MKKVDAANTINRFVIGLLLSASVVYHMLQGFASVRKDDSLFKMEEEATCTAFSNTVLPSFFQLCPNKDFKKP